MRRAPELIFFNEKSSTCILVKIDRQIPTTTRQYPFHAIKDKVWPKLPGVRLKCWLYTYCAKLIFKSILDLNTPKKSHFLWDGLHKRSHFTQSLNVNLTQSMCHMRQQRPSVMGTYLDHVTHTCYTIAAHAPTLSSTLAYYVG